MTPTTSAEMPPPERPASPHEERAAVIQRPRCACGHLDTHHGQRCCVYHSSCQWTGCGCPKYVREAVKDGQKVAVRADDLADALMAFGSCRCEEMPHPDCPMHGRYSAAVDRLAAALREARRV